MTKGYQQMLAAVAGESGRTYRIETSTDLVNWTFLREAPSAGAVTEFRDAEAKAFNTNFTVFGHAKPTIQSGNRECTRMHANSSRTE